MLRKRSTAMAPNVNSDSDDSTMATTPNAEQRPVEAMVIGGQQMSAFVAVKVLLEDEQRPGAAAMTGGLPCNTVAANAGNTNTPTIQSATARLTINALLTVERS